MRLPLLGLLGLLVASALAAYNDGADIRVYTVADLHGYLTGGPGSWVGREVLVRATAEPCPWWGSLAQQCGGRPLVLVGIDPENQADPLPLDRAAPPGLLVAARRLPLVGRLLPPPRPLPMFTPAHFRVKLLALPPGTCGQATCYEAVVLDAAP